MGVTLFLVSLIVTTAVTFTIPVMPHPRRNGESDNNMIKEDYHNNDDEIVSDLNLSSAVLPEKYDDDAEGMKSDWVIQDFLGNILPSTSFFSYSQSESSVGPNNSSPGILSRLFSNIIIERPTLFRVQFYNSDFEDGTPVADDNSTDEDKGPNAIFGSPLCLGLCIPVQVYSENTSIRILSDKQISLFPPAPTPDPDLDPTPLYPGDTVEVGDVSQNRNRSAEAVTAAATVDDTFGWLSGWIPIPTAPSLSTIQSSIQLPEFPNFPDIG